MLIFVFVLVGPPFAHGPMNYGPRLAQIGPKRAQNGPKIDVVVHIS